MLNIEAVPADHTYWNYKISHKSWINTKWVVTPNEAQNNSLAPGRWQESIQAGLGQYWD